MWITRTIFALVLAGGVTLSPVWCCCAAGAAPEAAEPHGCCRQADETPVDQPARCPHDRACGTIGVAHEPPATAPAAAPVVIALLPVLDAGPTLSIDPDFTSHAGEPPPAAGCDTLVALHVLLLT